MKRTKQLAARIAAVAAIALLGVTSVFADTRPSKETRERMRERAKIERERTTEARRSDNSRNRIERRRDDDRRSVTAPRSADSRYRDNRSRRDNDRSYRNDRSRRESQSYRNNRAPFRAHGRITNVRRYGNGYRVWVHGARYPFFVPHTHWNRYRDRFRVGLVISLGGYYNPGGYYDYYDDGRGFSAGALRGVVESVDYRRDTFVIRNEASGSFVTVINRDWRRNIRAGDYVEVYGDWSRSGVFQARDVDLLGYGR